MRKRVIIFFIGLVIIFCLTFFTKLSTPDSQSETIHLEVQEMISQKDSLFLVADSVSKMAEEIKIENDSLRSSTPKEVVKLITKVIENRQVEEVGEENDVLMTEPIRRDYELENLHQELKAKDEIIHHLHEELENKEKIIQIKDLQLQNINRDSINR